MRGLIIGAIGGLAELYLLTRLLRFAMNGRTALVVLLLFLKFVVLACAFAPVIIFLRKDLLWCGIGIASVLICGSLVIFFKNQNLKGGSKN